MKPLKNSIPGLDYVNQVRAALNEAETSSIIEYTQSARVEPIVMLDGSLTSLAFMPDVMQCLTNIFSGYYLQAFSLTVNVGEVNVKQILDKLNPNRNPWVSLESRSMTTHLELASAYEHGLPGRDAVALEARERNGEASTHSKDTSLAVRTPNTLAVGKLLELNVESNNSKATFPVNVRMIPVIVQPTDLVTTLTQKKKDKSFTGRLMQWQTGQIDFVNDLILCQDLLTEHKDSLMNDPTGILAEGAMRVNKNTLSAILATDVSVSTASNIIVISENTKAKVELGLRGKFKRFKVREQFFKDTYAMLLVIVDPEWEGITIYHRSIESPTTLSSRDIKTVGSKDIDIGEILKAYQLGNAPSF